MSSHTAVVKMGLTQLTVPALIRAKHQCTIDADNILLNGKIAEGTMY